MGCILEVGTSNVRLGIDLVPESSTRPSTRSTTSSRSSNLSKNLVGDNIRRVDAMP